ncbi:hypothetical protein BVC80_8361g5 [Macleaya cordata]|uniref:Uncharacterized protein n=1 Tax=Macleaya cordata TaxID=56857 RepID=A0A200QFB8_MACCD|nr:hypothetical protein BVC80_8361g5 [Macleaya cordata]
MGLSYAYELVQYLREGRHIPLFTVDSHWKHLSMYPSVEKNENFDYLSVLGLIRQRWLASTEVEREAMLDKLKEIATPRTTGLQEPSKSTILRGRSGTKQMRAQQKKKN